MKRLFSAFLASSAFLVLSTAAWASGSANQLYGYALAGANPKVVFVVIDSQGNGVKGVPLTAACTTGTLDLTSGNTAADGTFTIHQSGAALGSQITATAAGLNGSPFTITTANSVDRVGFSDPTYFWFDESRRLANFVSVTAGKGVLTLPLKSNFRFLPDDYTSNGRTITTSQDWNTAVQQSTTGPIQIEVYQGTFQNPDDIRVYDTTYGWLDNNFSAFGTGFLTFSATQPSHYLNAYAVDGASPTVCAVVTDTNGVGVSGVTVTIASTAGTFPLVSDVTGDSGRVYFYQQGGTLGNTITVSCNALSETSPVQIITQSSQAMQTTDRLFSWFSRKSRRVYTAVVNRQTNVLVTSVLAPTWSANYFTNGADANQRPAQSTGVGVYVDQTSQQPAIAAVPHGSTVSGDLFYLVNLPNLFHFNNCQCALTLPANETQYLVAFASGGANPTIWAAVTDATGNAVKGVTVNFGMQGTGTLAVASGPTSWNGMLTNSLSGATAEGNTITVSSAGLGTMTIVTSDSQAVASSDRVYSWYDPATHKILGAVVTLATNVMTVAGTSVGGSAVKRSGGLNTPTLGYALANEQNTPQGAAQPFIGHAGFGTISAGDFIRITQNGTVNQYDTHIIAAADPAKFLVAFAKGGVDPAVWALVMDNKGNGLENEPVTFASPMAGTMSLGTTVTGFGGYVVSNHTSGLLGNTITVSAPGMTPVTIYTAPPTPAGMHGDNGVAWYDASRMTIWGSSFDDANHVMETSQSWYDWFSGGPVVTYTSGAFKVNKAQAFDMNVANRKINPLAQWSIAFGTANVGDECWADLALIRSYMHINTVKPAYLRACASPGANPSSVRAIVVDAHGVGIPGVPVNFSASAGSMSGGPFWTTGLDGSVSSSQSGGSLAVGDVLTAASAGYPDVQMQTNASGTVANNSPAVFWYDPNSRSLNSLMIQQPWHNVMVSTQANILFAATDQTANNKTLSISGPKEISAQTPTFGYVAEGTSGAGDQVAVQNNTVWGINVGLLTLPADLSKYLWAFAAGGANPNVWAVVTDGNGNGLSGVPVHLTYPGPVTINLVTDATGMTTNARAGIALGNNISIKADGVSNTINITAANAAGVDTYARTMGWYDVTGRMGHGAFVSVPNNVLTSGTSATFTPVDTTPNGLTFALGASNQQTAAAPSSVLVSNGTQGQGDIVQFDESTATAAPDMQLSINVPTAGIVSSIVAGPDPVVNGQYLSVTMTVFNNGVTTVTSVSPTALAVAGGAAYFSGPVPPSVPSIAGGGSQNFIWTYKATAPGGVTFTGQALGVDSYTLLGLTSTATSSNPILVRNPNPPVLAITSFSTTPTAISGSYFTVTLTVQNNSGVDVPGALMLTPESTLGTSTPPGSVTQLAPLPAAVPVAPANSATFIWSFQAGTLGGVTLTGQVYATDPFTLMNVTKTASTYLIIRNPNPPKLTITSLAASPSAQLTGQAVYVTMTVRNDSDADVPGYINVTPSALTSSIAATLVTPPSPPNWALLPGQSAQFVWAYTAGVAGSLTFTGQAYTQDPFSLQNVTATASTSNVVTVTDPNAPAIVVSALTAGPVSPNLLVGQFISVTMTVTNNSGPDVPNPLTITPLALGIVGGATPHSGPFPSQAYVPRGNTCTFWWDFTAAAAGNVSFSGQAVTVNPFNFQGVTATVMVSNGVVVRNPHAPSLVPVISAFPLTASVGQFITVSMTVTNNSDLEVASPVTVTPLAFNGLTGVTWVSGPVPAVQSVARNNSGSFSWTYLAAGSGNTFYNGRVMVVNPFDDSGVTVTATAPVSVTIQTPAAISGVLASPATAEQLGDFNVTLTVTNNGQATANGVSPTALTLSGTNAAALKSGPVPASAAVLSGHQQNFVWTYTAAGNNGAIQFFGQAAGVDANSNSTLSTGQLQSQVTNVFQGALNLDQVSSSSSRVFRGQNGIPVTMQVRNTSFNPVTLTATTLNFNGSTSADFVVIPNPGNLQVAPGGSSFTLQFTVNVGKNAPLGSVVLDGRVAGTAGGKAMSTMGAIQTGTWEIDEAKNKLQQNYPNPFRLSQYAYTTFEYYVKDNVPVSLKIYNLAGELVAVLVDGSPGVGHYTVPWNGHNGDAGQTGKELGSGVYLAVFQTGGDKEILKVVVIK